MDYDQLAKEFGGSPISTPPPKEEVDYAALASEFGGSVAPTTPKKEVDYSSLAAEFGGTPLSRDTGDLAVSGAKAGVTGLQSMFEGVSFLREVGALDRITSALSVYDAIDKGEITSPAQASKMGLNVTSAAKYLKATPEARLKMRENQFGSQGERKALVTPSKPSKVIKKKWKHKVKGYLTLPTSSRWMGSDSGLRLTSLLLLFNLPLLWLPQLQLVVLVHLLLVQGWGLGKRLATGWSTSSAK
jgi:hypothetical protein